MKIVVLLLGSLIGLLMLIAIASLVWNPLECRGPQHQHRSAAFMLNRLDTVLEAFFDDTGSYPSDLAELLDSHRDGWDGPYIRSEALHDPWNNPLVYAVSASGTFYVLLSFGADGSPGGDGVYSDIISQKSGPEL